MKLSDTDKTILEYLFYDCRLSTNKLAKLIGLKQSSVYNRIKKLEQEGFIRAYDALIKLSLFHSVSKIYFCDLTDEQVREIEVSPYCFTFQQTFGMYKYQIMTIFKTQKQMVEFEAKLPEQRNESLVADIGGVRGSIFDMPIKTQSLNSYPDGTKKLPIAKEDVLLFQKLFGGGARKTLVELSRETGLSVDTIKYKRNKFYQNGYFFLCLAQPGHAFKSVKITYHVFDLSSDISLSLIMRTPRMVMYTLSENKLIVVQLSYSYNDYLKYQRVLFEIVKPYLNDVHSFIIEKPIVINRLNDLSIVDG